MKRLTLLLTCFLVSMGLAIAQTTQVRGTVVDEYGDPVIGASVEAKGHPTIGAITNIEGTFSLDVPQSVQTLFISYVGKERLEVAVAPNVHVVLKTSDQMLDDVIVIAYGTAKKHSFTGSAGVMKSEQLEKRSVASITKALDGAVAGLQSTSGGGQPGSESSVIIRGFGSINASNSPLYVVDGIPYDGSLSSINPNDIESVTVLKDASASTLYGSRAANGVIMITTRKGTEGQKPSVSFRGSWGFSSRAVDRYDTVNEKEYMEIMYMMNKNEAIYQNGVNPGTAGTTALEMMAGSGTGTIGGERYNPFNYSIMELIDPTTGKVRSDARLNYSEDWVDNMLADAPLRQEYQLTVTGSGANSSYLISLGYLNEEGLLKTTSFDRYSGRLNVDTQPTDWFKTGLNLSVSQTTSNFLDYDSNTSASGNVWYSAQFIAPIYPVYMYDANGSPVLDENGKKQFDYGTTRPTQSNWNSIATLYDDKTERQRNNANGRTYIQLGGDKVKHDILKRFTFSSNFGFDYVNSRYMMYYNPYNGNATSTNGRMTKSTNQMLSYTFNQLLNYNQTFNDVHEVEVLLGHEFYHKRFDYLMAQKTNFAFGGFYELAAAATISDATSYQDNHKIESYLSRLNYNFDQKYYLSASFRTDGSSRFHSDDRWAQFWSIGGSWRMSQETFMEDVDFLNNLTVKASYGTQGNENIVYSNGAQNYYPWQATYDLGYPNSSMSGAFITAIENKELTWEKSQNFNAGFEASILSNRLVVEAEYFHKKTTDLLLWRPKALSTGFSGMWDNVGDMVNQGFEFSVSGDILRTKDLRWNAKFIGSVLKNEVTRLNKEANGEIKSSNTIIKEGYPINSFYVAESAGVDPATGLQLFWAPQIDADGNVLTDEPWEVTSDYTRATSGRVIKGDRIPDLYGSISTSLQYRDFDFSVLATYSIGGKILDHNYADLIGTTSVIYNGTTFHKDALKAWREPGDVTDIPKLYWSQTTPITDRVLINASYFAIKNISLGYTIPSNITSKAGIKNVRLFAQGDNLFLFSHMKGLDPQYNFSGNVQNYSYVSNRVISFGVDIKF